MKNEKNFSIPIFCEKEDVWVVEVDGRIEKGSLLYVTAEEVVNAVLDNPAEFSIEGFETYYSDQEKRILHKLQEKLVEKL